MKGYSRRFHWHGVERTFFSFTVVAAIRNQCGFDEVRFLRLYDVADIDQLILPRHRGDELEVGVFYHVGHVAAGNRGNRFLPKWSERDDAVVDGIAARLLIGLDQLLKGVILVGDKSLRPTNSSGLGSSICDIRTPERAQSSNGRGIAQHRPAGQPHDVSPPVFDPGLARAAWFLSAAAKAKTGSAGRVNGHSAHRPDLGLGVGGRS